MPSLKGVEVCWLKEDGMHYNMASFFFIVSCHVLHVPSITIIVWILVLPVVHRLFRGRVVAWRSHGVCVCFRW